MSDEPDFEEVARKIITSDLPLDRYIASFAFALRDMFERGIEIGYRKGSDDMGNVVVQLQDDK